MKFMKKTLLLAGYLVVGVSFVGSPLLNAAKITYNNAPAPVVAPALPEVPSTPVAPVSPVEQPEVTPTPQVATPAEETTAKKDDQAKKEDELPAELQKDEDLADNAAMGEENFPTLSPDEEKEAAEEFLKAFANMVPEEDQESATVRD